MGFLVTCPWIPGTRADGRDTYGAVTAVLRRPELRVGFLTVRKTRTVFSSLWRISVGEHPVVHVRWIDSTSEYEQAQIDELGGPEDLEMTTVGFLVRDLPDRISIARDLCSKAEVRGTITIPRFAIKEMTALG